MTTKTDLYYENKTKQKKQQQIEPFGFLLMIIVSFLAMFFPIVKAGIR